MPVTATARELFGEQMTAAELFGKDVVDETKIKDEIPDGDRVLIQPPFYQKLYENILSGDKDLDSFIPPDKRETLQATVPDYEAQAKKLLNSAYLADQLGIDIESAYVTHDQLVKEILKSDTPDDAYDRIKNRFNNGRLQVQIMDLGYAILIGEGDMQQNLNAIKSLQSKLTSDYKEDLRSFGEQVLGATSEQLPIMWEAIKASPYGAVPGGIIGALVAVAGGQLGPQALAPEEAYTVPALGLVGMKIGGGMAAANRIRQLEAGGMYLELLEMEDQYGNKIDPAIAKVAAHAVGAINGGIELAEWSVLLSTFGIGTKVFENASAKVTGKFIAEGTIKNVVAKALLKYGGALTAEVVQEIMQETTNVTFGELAKEINNQLKGTDIPPVTAEQLKARYYEVTAESLKGFALLVAPGPIVTGAKEVVIMPKPPVKEAVKMAEKPAGLPAAKAKPPTPTPITPESVREALTEPVEREVEITEEEIEFTPQETADLAQLEALPEEEYKPSKRKPAKKIREFLTPGSTVETVVTEYKALKMAMKKAAQAARAAFSEGKKEGIAKTKQHYKDLKEAEKQRKGLRKRIDAAVKKITKKPARTVDFFYREAIEVLQEGIDPKFRTKKTKAMRQRMRDFLERATPEQRKDFPEKLAQTLNKKDLSQYTVEELEQLANDIAALEKLGKTKQKARLAVEAAERERNIEKIVGTADTVKIEPPQPKGIDFSAVGIEEAIKAAYLWTLRIPRILDWLDGKKGTFSGAAHRLFYDQINRQTDEELRYTDERFETGDAKMKELNINAAELTEVIDFSELQNGLVLTKEQMMGIYAGLKNQLATDAVVNGNKISLKAAYAVVGNLEQKYKDLADWIISDYDKNYPRVREAHIEVKNEDMGHEQFYSPMVRLEKNERTIYEDLADQLLQRYGLKRGYAQKGFTIKRKNISPEHQKPIDLRLVSVWQSQVAKQEHYVHFAKLLQDLRKILSDGRIKAVIEQRLGKQGWGLIDKYLSRVANPNIYRGFDDFTMASRILRQNVAIAYLSFNLLTITKQAPSLGLYFKDAGPAAMISSIGEIIRNPRQVWDMVREKDPQIKHAFIEREITELKQAKKQIKDDNVLAQINKILAQVGDIGMEGIRFVDGIVRTIGWNAIYQKNLQLGLSEAEAVREAQNSTLRTQPAAGAKDVAQLYSTNEFLNWFTMFTNQLNNIWNISTYDTFAYWSNGKYQAAAMSLFGVSLSAITIWMIVNKKIPEDEEDLLDAATDQFLNMLPFIGSGAMTGKRGWGTVSPPPIEAGRAIGAVLSAKDKEKAAIKAIEKIAVLGGIPVTALKRGKKYLETLEPIELIGGSK